MEKRIAIELRSEKVRNVVGKMPPPLLRTGISVVAGVLLVIVGLLYYVPYPRTVTVPVEIRFCHKDSTYHAVAHLPLPDARPVHIGQKATVAVQSLQGDYRLAGQVHHMVEDHGAVDLSIVLTDTAPYAGHLNTSPSGRATVYLARTAVLKRVFK